MTFFPQRRLGLIIGIALLLILLAAIIVSIAQLGLATISVWILVWVLVPLICLPLALVVAYNLYGLLTARYGLDRDAFTLNWGWASDVIPIVDLSRPRRAAELGIHSGPRRSLWWPGCVVGRREVAQLGTVEFFATTPLAGTVILRTGGRALAISPPDVDAFLRSYTEAARMGSLQPAAPQSQRPDFVFGRVWDSRPARILVLAGLAIPLALLAYLALRAPGLPAEIPFGFTPTGVPEPLSPPGRLLLLPLIGGLCWLINLAIGAWFFRQEADRAISYALWGIVVLVGVLLWVAALQLLAVARIILP
jgi:hypothetical protein